MKIFILTTLCLLIAFNVFAQEKCNASELSKSQQKELKVFWENLKDATSKRDKNALKTLFNFPYNCSFCVSGKSDKPYITVTEKLFLKESNEIFFSDYFLDVVNNSEILKILNGNFAKNGKCEYSFSFPIIKPSKNGEGKQGFLTIKQAGKKYKIFSAWAIP
jgi:hypothetical protein